MGQERIPIGKTFAVAGPTLSPIGAAARNPVQNRGSKGQEIQTSRLVPHRSGRNEPRRASNTRRSELRGSGDEIKTREEKKERDGTETPEADLESFESFYLQGGGGGEEGEEMAENGDRESGSS